MRAQPRWTGRAALLAMAFAASPVLAQTEKDDDAAPVPEPAAAPVESKQGEDRGKAEFPRVSDSEETIYAVQRKAYLVNRKVELTLMPSFSFTDRFVSTIGGGVSASYHFAENFALELYGNFLFPDESGLTSEILEEGKLTPEIAKLTQMLWGSGIGAQWSPIYGKIEIFDTALGTFAFYVSAGVGVGQSRVQCTPASKLDPEVFGAGATCQTVQATGGAMDAFKVVYEPSQLQLMTALAGGVRFYFSNSIGLKLEVKDYIFPARVFRPDSSELTQRFTDAIRNNVFVQIGVSFLFGGEDN